MTSEQRKAILLAAKSAETVVIPPGRPRDAVSAYAYADPPIPCWFASNIYGRLTNHECNVALRLIEMQLDRQARVPVQAVR